jgi:hypothetical protein
LMVEVIPSPSRHQLNHNFCDIETYSSSASERETLKQGAYQHINM